MSAVKKIGRFWKIILFDTLGVLCIIAAPLTGWLPGPGGIPLFIIGLSLLAIHHEWAQRYIDLAREYADRAGDIIFAKNPKLQLAYDIISPPITAAGIWLLLRHSALWTTSLGLSLTFLGITLFLGNRSRWHRLRRSLKLKR